LRDFDVTGIEQALAGYVWPSSFVAPADGAGYVAGQRIDCLQWDTTVEALNYLRGGLCGALGNDDATDEEVRCWTSAILQWGLGARGAAAQAFLQGVEGGVQAYLRRTRGLLALDTLDTDDITAATIPLMNSGLCKIHSLAAPDGLAIFDSRVAAALGECVNRFLHLRRATGIPQSLRLMRTGAPNRTPRPVGTDNHPMFARDFRWAQTQVRVSWLLNEVLVRRRDVFADDPPQLRLHKFEAGLFMMGAQLCGHYIPE
jgi:hypothetical protein